MLNPLDFKEALAQRVVTELDGETEAISARNGIQSGLSERGENPAGSQRWTLRLELAYPKLWLLSD